MIIKRQKSFSDEKKENKKLNFDKKQKVALGIAGAGLAAQAGLLVASSKYGNKRLKQLAKKRVLNQKEVDEVTKIINKKNRLNDLSSLAALPGIGSAGYALGRESKKEDKK